MRKPILFVVSLTLIVVGIWALERPEEPLIEQHFFFEVSDVRVIAPAVPGRPAVAYMSITAETGTDTLVSVATRAAEAAHIHQSVQEDGVSRMVPVDGLVIPYGETVRLEPGAYHIMLMGFNAAVGDEVTLTLLFDTGAVESVTATVAAFGAGAD